MARWLHRIGEFILAGKKMAPSVIDIGNSVCRNGMVGQNGESGVPQGSVQGGTGGGILIINSLNIHCLTSLSHPGDAIGIRNKPQEFFPCGHIIDACGNLDRTPTLPFI